MAGWSPLRRLLAGVDERLTVSWSELDRLAGGLPPSVYDHRAYWSGKQSRWPGSTTVDVRVGESVTFVRRDPERAPPRSLSARSRPRPVAEPRPPSVVTGRRDVVLVGCVKSKLDRPAPARELYTSALFRKQRAYAEATGVPWFVLSAEYGLVEPARVIEPYELHLASTSRAYRTEWGRRVVDDLAAKLGGLGSLVIEIHAGAAYVEALRDGLAGAGATIVEPLAGLETEVLAELDPPLNLAKMPKSAMRVRLSQLRRLQGKK